MLLLLLLLPIIIILVSRPINTTALIILLLMFLSGYLWEIYQKKVTINQLVTNLENNRPDSNQWEKMFSVSTKTFQLSQIDKLISRDGQYYDGKSAVDGRPVVITLQEGRFVGATLKIKNLTDKTCKINSSFFDQIFKKYDLLKFTKTTLNPLEETLVYIVFKNNDFASVFPFIFNDNYQQKQDVEYNKIKYYTDILIFSVFPFRFNDNAEYNKINIALNYYSDMLAFSDRSRESLKKRQSSSENYYRNDFLEAETIIDQIKEDIDNIMFQASNTFCQTKL